jgi:hypothetical protein
MQTLPRNRSIRRHGILAHSAPVAVLTPRPRNMTRHAAGESNERQRPTCLHDRTRADNTVLVPLDAAHWRI